MNILELHEFAASVKGVSYWHAVADCMRNLGRGSEHFEEPAYKVMLEDVLRACEASFRAGLVNTAQDIGLIHQRLDLDRMRSDYSYISAELNNLHSSMLKSAAKRLFLRVEEHRTACVDNPNLMGASVLAAFESTRADIVDAGNCLAADCNTAAVFHLMRVVEHGLRALASHLGVRRMTSVRKSGRKLYTPVAHSQWEIILNGLPSRIDKRLKKLRPGRIKQGWQEFYQPVIVDINAIREAWRNHTMHARSAFNAQEADAIRMRVDAIMQRLASRIREV